MSIKLNHIFFFLLFLYLTLVFLIYQVILYSNIKENKVIILQIAFELVQSKSTSSFIPSTNLGGIKNGEGIGEEMVGTDIKKTKHPCHS